MLGTSSCLRAFSLVVATVLLAGCCQSRPVDAALTVRSERGDSALVGKTIPVDFALVPRSKARELETVRSAEYFGGGNPLREAFASPELRSRITVPAGGESFIEHVRHGDSRWASSWIPAAGGWDSKDPLVIVAVAQIPGLTSATATTAMDTCSWGGDSEVSFELLITASGLRFNRVVPGKK